MSWSDVIADMLVRIKNAQAAGYEEASIPNSRFKQEILRVMKKEGFIEDFIVEGSATKKTIKIFLKYGADRKPFIRGISRESKAGVRKYIAARDLKPVLGGIGIAVISTSKGVMTDKEAKKNNLGGEVICKIW